MQRSQVSFVRNYTRNAFRCDENIGKSLKSCGVRLHTGNAWRCDKNICKGHKSHF